MRLSAGRDHEVGLWQSIGVDAIGHAQHARRPESLGFDAPPQPSGGYDPFALNLDAGHFDRPQTGDRGDHPLRKVVMAGPRIGEKNDLERAHLWTFLSCEPRLITLFQAAWQRAPVPAQSSLSISKEIGVADNPGPDTDWILKAMVAVAGSDRELDGREIRLIQQVYQERTGNALAEEEIALTAVANAKGDLLAHFGTAGKTLGVPVKEEIIRSAYLVLLADNRIAGEERKKLQDISAALQIPEIHFGAILEDLAVWLAGQKS